MWNLSISAIDQTKTSPYNRLQMKIVKHVKVQLFIGLITGVVSYIFFNSLFLSILWGMGISFINTILDKLFIHYQQFSSASSGKSFGYLVVSVLIRLSSAIGGLYLGFTLFAPQGVITGFVIAHVGYMLDKLKEVK